MTTLVARPPLQVLSMSAVQSTSRRHSARLQQKDDIHSTNGAHERSSQNATSMTARVQTSAANAKKRKNYDEEEDGFVFSRVKKKKPRQSTTAHPEPSSRLPGVLEAESTTARTAKDDTKPEKHSAAESQNAVPESPSKKRRNRMSFSTPGVKTQNPVRRSKRLSTEAQDQGSPSVEEAKDLRPPKVRKDRIQKHKPSIQPEEAKIPAQQEKDADPTTAPSDESHSSTKIALPFADTPVISRNKAMREGKSGKGERRSSLGLRGRRASSLIDSGISNALPHTEVESGDFYKHIESDLMEPRRMKQLLTWCATRVMHPKPQGMNFEEASAISAARVIEEEVLKDLANKSELSDWFSREDVPSPAVPLPKRPNPKNVQNVEKIAELEEQIRRLRQEKDALETLLQLPSISKPPQFDADAKTGIDGQMLSETDASILRSLNSARTPMEDLTSRINKVTTNLEPAIDMFADGIHKINQYRTGADGVATQVLSICASKLAERERAGRLKAMGGEDERSPGRDLSSVLHGLSKADR